MGVTMSLVGTAMMVGMGGGMITNAGLSIGEQNDRCKMINELKDEILEMKKQYNILRNGLLKENVQLNKIFNTCKDKTKDMKKVVDKLKTHIKFSLDREEYIYFCLVLTIIIIMFTKMCIVIINR